MSDRNHEKMQVEELVDWSGFCARHDMKWSKKSSSWDCGAMIGNGLLGAMIYGAEDKTKRNAIRFITGRTDVFAEAPEEGHLKSRVPLGEIDIESEGLIFDGTSMELDLYRAEWRGHLVTTRGSIEARSFVHSRIPVIVVEIQPDEREAEAAVRWYAYPEISAVMKNEDGINFNQYIPDIVLEERSEGEIRIQIQRFSAAEGCTVVSTCIRDSGKMRYYLTVSNGTEDETVREAVTLIRNTAGLPAEELVESHRSWWRAYYEKSFVSLSDTRLEGFYLIQMYKLASAAREDSRIMDNQGPWLSATPWPRAWYNMNVQMAYSLVYTSNHLDLGESLCRNLDSHMDSLVNNVPQAYREDSAAIGRNSACDLKSMVGDEVGNLPWLMHNYWRQYRYSMDEDMLRNRLYPLLKKSIQYYIHLLKKGEDGKLHLPKMISPEYASFKQLTAEDTTYDLSLLRWGCITLLRSCELLGLEEEKKETWQSVLDHLVDYHQDETGLMIGAGVPLQFGHRHFSHLLPVFPLHLISGDEPEEKELIHRSMRNWMKREGDLRGFTFTGAASLAASIGEGEEALRYVKTALELFKPNTMYKEAGPVIESPLAAAESIQDMLLVSWGREIRVFPAVPQEWEDITIHNLRTEGAFLISAVRRGGILKWVRVCSRAGEPCRIKAGFTGRVKVQSDSDVKMREEDGCVCLDLEKGGEAVLYTGDEVPELRVEPVAPQVHMMNYFGEYKPWRLYGIPIND